MKQLENFGKEKEFGLVNRLDNDTAGLLYFAKKPAMQEQFRKKQTDEFYKIYMCEVRGQVMVDKTIEKLSDIEKQFVKKETELAEIFTSEYTQKVFAKLGGVQKFTQEGVDIPSCFLPGDLQKHYPIREGLAVSYPIMHSLSAPDRMITVTTVEEFDKGRGEKHEVTTALIPISYDPVKHTTMCYACIQRGVRHQIRIHTAKIGYPIIGDVIYNKNMSAEDTALHLWSVALISQGSGARNAFDD